MWHRTASHQYRRSLKRYGDAILSPHCKPPNASEDCATRRSGHFCPNELSRIRFKVNAMGVQPRYLRSVTIGESTFHAISTRRTHLWHKCDVSIISHTNCGLVSPDKPRDGWIVVVIGSDADLVLSNLWRPVSYANGGVTKGILPSVQLRLSGFHSSKLDALLLSTDRALPAGGESAG